MIYRRICNSVIFVSTLILCLTGCKHETEKSDEYPSLISFGIIADAQYAYIPENGNRYYRSSLNNMDKAAKKLNSYHLDL